MSRRTPSQMAALDAAQRATCRAVQAREAAILRAQATRRIALFVLLGVALLTGAAVVCTVMVVGDQAAKEQGRAA